MCVHASAMFPHRLFSLIENAKSQYVSVVEPSR